MFLYQSAMASRFPDTRLIIECLFGFREHGTPTRVRENLKTVLLQIAFELFQTSLELSQWS